MKNSILILIGLVSIFAVNGIEASAQQSAVERRNERLSNSYLTQLNDQRSIARSRIENRLNDIKQAVELSDAQSGKLDIAAKGALRSYNAKADEEMILKAKRLGFNFDPTAEFEDTTTQSFSRSRVFTVSQAIESETIWTSSLEKILTPEQQTTLKTWTDERIARQRDIALELFIARVDSNLLLSQEQRMKLKDVINERYGKQLAAKLNGQINSAGFSPGRRTNTPPDVTYLEGILNESQLVTWVRVFGSETSRMQDETDPEANMEQPDNKAREGIRRIPVDRIEIQMNNEEALRAAQLELEARMAVDPAIEEAIEKTLKKALMPPKKPIKE